MTLELLFESGVESMLILLGDDYAWVSDFFLVLASVEHLLISILDLGLIWLMRCVEPNDWNADHLELEL
jgi:hypothetical protein